MNENISKRKLRSPKAVFWVSKIFEQSWNFLLCKFSLSWDFDWDVGDDFPSVTQSGLNHLTFQDGLFLNVNLLIGLERHSDGLGAVVHVQRHFAGIHSEQVPRIRILGITVVKNKAVKFQWMLFINYLVNK